MNHDNLKQRTRQFALRVIRMSEAMPRSIAGDVLSRPIVRSATSVTAIAVSSIRTARAGKGTPHSALRTSHSK